MRFDELEKKLNEMIEGDKELRDAKRFNGKDALKSWLKDTIKEIVGEELIRKDWEDKGDKFEVTYDYSGRYNYVEIKYKGCYIADINFKYTYTSSYGIGYWWKDTTYGIKSVSLKMAYDFENCKTFEGAKERAIKIINKNNNDHIEYIEEETKKYKDFADKLKEIGMTIDDVNKMMGEFKYFYNRLEYDERRKFNVEVLGKTEKETYYYF